MYSPYNIPVDFSFNPKALGAFIHKLMCVSRLERFTTTFHETSIPDSLGIIGTQFRVPLKPCDNGVMIQGVSRGLSIGPQLCQLQCQVSLVFLTVLCLKSDIFRVLLKRGYPQAVKTYGQLSRPSKLVVWNDNLI